MSSITALRVATASTLALIELSAIGTARAEISVSWLSGKAPAELLACTTASIPNDNSDEAQRILGQLTERLVQTAIKSSIAKIGEPFVFRLTPGQVEDTYPISLDFCMPIDKKPPVDKNPQENEIVFQYVDIAERAVRLGYCASPASADCQAAVDNAITPAPPAPSPAPTAPAAPLSPPNPFALKLNEVGVRSGAWHTADPPADVAAMQATVYRMWPPAQAPFGAGATAGGDDTQPAPRELKKIPGTPAAGAPPARIDAPAAPSTAGFVFSIPPQ
jgi:hypothetical protein